MNFVFVFHTERMNLYETSLHLFVQIRRQTIRIIDNVLIAKETRKRQRDMISVF